MESQRSEFSPEGRVVDQTCPALDVDAYFDIFDRIPDPTSLAAFARASQLLSEIARLGAPLKKAQFARQVDDPLRTYYALPNGTLHGPLVDRWGPGDPRLARECCYQDGKLHGPYLIYNSDGSLRYRYHFKAGVQIGQAVRYRRDGSVADTMIYSEDGELQLHVSDRYQVVAWYRGEGIPHGSHERWAGRDKVCSSVYFRGFLLISIEQD